VPEPTASRAQIDAALRVCAARPRRSPTWTRRPAAPTRGPGGVLVVPLHVTVTEDDAINVATDLREELGIAAGARDGVTLHLAGQGARVAGLQHRSKE